MASNLGDADPAVASSSSAAVLTFSLPDDLRLFLDSLAPSYAHYTDTLWAAGVKSLRELANASTETLRKAGVTNGWHIDNIKASADAASSSGQAGAGAGARRAAEEERQFRVWKIAASTNKVTFRAPGNIQLDDLKDCVAEHFTYHQKVEFTLVEPTTERDVNQSLLATLLHITPTTKAVDLMIRSEEVAFSAKVPGGISGEACKAQLQALLQVSAVDGVPVMKGNAVKKLCLEDTAAINLGRGTVNESITFKELLDNITTSLRLRTDATVETWMSENDDRAYIDPILVGATLVAASTGTGAGSSSSPGVVGPQDQQRNLQLRTEQLLVGHKAVGKVDWVLFYRTLAVIVAEAKHEDLKQAWVQLYRQIAAMLDELARAAADTKQQKKRTSWQAFELPVMQAYAVLCTAREWHVVKYTPPRGGKKGSICRGGVMQLSLGLKASREELLNQVRELVLTLAWVLHQQMDALDQAIAAHPELETAAEHSEADAEGVLLAELHAGLEETGEEGAADDQGLNQEE